MNISGQAIGRQGGPTRPGDPHGGREAGSGNQGVQNLGPGQVIMSGNVVGPGATIVNGVPVPFVRSPMPAAGRQADVEMEAG